MKKAEQTVETSAKVEQSLEKERSTKDRKLKKVEPIIYCGPNFSLVSLAKHTVFSKGIPNHVLPHFDQEKCPELERLFVPVSKFNQFEQRLQHSGSAEQTFFNAVENYIKKAV